MDHCGSIFQQASRKKTLPAARSADHLHGERGGKSEIKRLLHTNELPIANLR